MVVQECCERNTRTVKYRNLHFRKIRVQEGVCQPQIALILCAVAVFFVDSGSGVAEKGYCCC